MFLTRFAIAAISFYQRHLSRALPSVCRYTPSCSRYAQIAYGRYGFVRGSLLTIGRILRCAPWSGQGYDPVPARSDGRPDPDWVAEMVKSTPTTVPFTLREPYDFEISPAKWREMVRVARGQTPIRQMPRKRRTGVKNLHKSPDRRQLNDDADPVEPEP